MKSDLLRSSSARQLAERLLLLGLALEESLLHGDPVESQALFFERENCLDELAKRSIDSETRLILEQAAQQDKKLIGLLSDERTLIAKEMAASMSGRQARTAYRAADSYLQ
jgi:hypothetical protein